MDCAFGKAEETARLSNFGVKTQWFGAGKTGRSPHSIPMARIRKPDPFEIATGSRIRSLYKDWEDESGASQSLRYFLDPIGLCRIESQFGWAFPWSGFHVCFLRTGSTYDASATIILVPGRT